MDRDEMLKNVPIFSELEPNALSSLGELMTPRSFRAGDAIVTENDQPVGFFIIVSGRVEVVRGADGSAPQSLATLGPGEFFGEMALFEGYPRSATVRALEDTECLVLPRWHFTGELHSHPEIAVGVIKVLVRRLRDTEARLSE
ncbi:MAG: cyclic nucleotide-binding domain-containing protein [Dehalococcoidia bacterium]